ncbi:ATP-binding protein [Chryseobacterium sp. 2987]|uniref:ATP-binding protein n=1 Tax=Chryseobacterium sp. 2987 TaxID=2817767 RepID=UPI00285BE80C|nr:ATP-binding protein [Chryseobacterium sp. 2987]MDR6922068.1 hypothetical protein [Chryseobacterium sp. 2987]
MGIIGFFKNIFNQKKYSFGNVTESEINIYENCEINEKPSFELDESWFETLFNKHYTKDIQSKYDSSLFVDQNQGKAISLLNEIKFNESYISRYKNELRVLSEWLDKFPKEYQELKEFLAGESIDINIKSKQYIQLELLLNKIEEIKGKINEQKEILERGINSDVLFLPVVAFEDYEYAFGFDYKNIKEYDEDLKFINKKPSYDYPIAIVFRRQSEILSQINLLKSINVDFFNRIKLIHGKAGMGKSNISAFLVNSLKDENHPVILVKAKDFRGSPDEFNRILMEQLLVPPGYSLEEVLEKINIYGKRLNKRVVLIFDGLNETTFENQGFSKIWENNLDNFINLLSNHKYIYFVATLRTSYISRIWANNRIPHSNFELRGFNSNNLKLVVSKYFNHYRIVFDQLTEGDIFYFKTPLLIDLYCQMLNPSKEVDVEAIFGLNGFKSVFERYILNLSHKVKQKLSLGTIDQVSDGINRCSNEMINNLEANIPIMDFYSLMQNQNVTNVNDTIGNEILSEYLIYLDENYNGRDVVIHTQQEVGGYLLANKLISNHGSVDNVVNSDFFKTKIVGIVDPLHQLKDDILKFLLIEASENSQIYEIENAIIKRFTLVTLQTEKINTKTLELSKKLTGKLKSKDEINDILTGLNSNFFDPTSPLNFNFVKEQLLLLDNDSFEFTWSRSIYDNHYEIVSLLNKIYEEDLLNQNVEKRELLIEFLILLFETTIRELRDQVYVLLLNFYSNNPKLIFEKVIEYSSIKKPYVYERLVSICYGITLIHQNSDEFVNTTLKNNVNKIYELQFGKNPRNPVYNYIVIDSIKHLVDFAIFKEVFVLSEEDSNDFNNYKFELNSWFDIDDEDRKTVEDIYLHWSLDDNPDPLRGDFVHYTIPRLEERDSEDRLDNVANIYKRIIQLGYSQEIENLNEQEIKFRRGEAIYGVEDKIDRLGKKYSWISFFDYAGYLLKDGRLKAWSDDDSYDKKRYDRLSDVDIEISHPKPLVYKEKLYNIDLFAHSTNMQDWVYTELYDSLNSLYENGEFTLLSGFINQRPDKSYESRSFLMIESFFIKKETISGNIKDIFNRNFNWRNDVVNNNSSLTKIYFGELYWADNIPIDEMEWHNLPLIEQEEVDYIVKPLDFFSNPDTYSVDDIGTVIKRKQSKQIAFQYEPTVVGYLWESDSKVIPTISSTIPTTNMGKQLSLKADVPNLQILDVNNTLAFKSYDYEENYYDQNFEYFRTDLLKEYMAKNDLLLVYQIKQHTYDRNAGDKSGDFRGMKFFLSKLCK